MNYNMARKEIALLVFPALVAFFILACGPRGHHDINHPHLFRPCASHTGENAYYLSFGSLIVSMQKLGWTVEQMDWERGYVMATACYRGSARACVTMVAEVAQDGSITMYNPQEYRLHRKLVKITYRWMRNLQHQHSVHCSYGEEFFTERFSEIPGGEVPSGEVSSSEVSTSEAISGEDPGGEAQEDSEVAE